MNKYLNQTDKYDAVIEEDEPVGFYLYIYDKITKKCLFDFLQDTLEIAKIQAQRDFSFDPQTWIKVG
jgi:hypothetical protein